MHINIQISDELTHRTDKVSTPSFTVDTGPSSYAASDAMSGGAAPEMAGEIAVSPGQTSYDALSAGSAEQQVAPVAPSAAGQANNDGGPAPS
jgi:hypothetical protein